MQLDNGFLVVLDREQAKAFFGIRQENERVDYVMQQSGLPDATCVDCQGHWQLLHEAYCSVDVGESVLAQCILGGRPMHSGAYHLLLVRPDLVRIVAEQLASVDETRFLAVWKGEPETGRGLGREVTALYRQAAERGDAVVFAAKA